MEDHSRSDEMKVDTFLCFKIEITRKLELFRMEDICYNRTGDFNLQI